MKSYDGPDKEHAIKEEMLEDDEIEVINFLRENNITLEEYT